MGRAVCVGLLAVLVGACAATPSPEPTNRAPSEPNQSASAPVEVSEPPSTSAVVHDGASGVTFDRPGSWDVWRPNDHSPMTGGPLVYVSTEPLLPACAVAPSASPNPPDANGSACSWPLDELPPGGVLATWMNSRIL